MKDKHVVIYAILPSDLYYTKDLTAEEKLIAERITALCKKEGYSWISNKALADMYGIREDTVSKHIKHLKEYGYIRCVYGKTNKCKSNRTIYLTNNIWDKYPKGNCLNEQIDNDYMSKHNNKYKNKNNSKNNIPSWMINSEECKIEECSPEDIEYMEELNHHLIAKRIFIYY